MGIKLLVKLGVARTISEKYRPYFPVSFFLLGLLFDVATTGRIDETRPIIQQGIFLLVISLILFSEMIVGRGLEIQNRFAQKIWSKKEAIIHFLFGSLLSSYTIFYFKSASALASLIFFILLGGLLVLNESPRLRQANLSVKTAIFSLCLSTYLIYVVPILLGMLGPAIFLFSVFLSCLFGYVFLGILNKDFKTPFKQEDSKKKFLIPFATVQGVLVLLYWTNLIPPVPVSIQYMGIYRDVKKENGKYILYHERPWWAYWQKGDQSFKARPGDRIYSFARIFSPSNFGEKIQVQWFHREKSGWKNWNTIPIDILGGRKEGFRAYTYKENYRPGDWRVHFNTSDGREIGRIFFSVEESADTSPREFKKDVF